MRSIRSFWALIAVAIVCLWFINAYGGSIQVQTSAPSGTTGSIGGGALIAGQSATGTASIPSATTVGRPCIASPSDGTSLAALSVGVSVNCSITSSGTATVVVTSAIAGTPTAKTYMVTVP